MTSFSWLDYSEHERRQAMEVIDLFREDETRDELGLGTIRDPLSDLMFPGTSTIQTRARYFLFVPWVHCELERKRIPGADLAHKSRQLQDKLRRALMEGGEETGVIGYRAGLHVQRLPSSVYWIGLRQWGILRFEGTEDDFRRFMDAHYRRLDAALPADGGERLDFPRVLWDHHLPPAPEGFLSSTTFALSAEEAQYLIGCVEARVPRSLLTHLLMSRQTIADDTRFPWEMRWASSLPASLQVEVGHARDFSETMHGAALLYNLLLAEGKPGGEYVEHYREELSMWWDRLNARRDELLRWDRASFWNLVKTSGGRVPELTRKFVEAWLEIALGSEAVPAEHHGARRLITEREKWLKRSRARIGSQRALENWGGAAGSVQLNYRWNRPVRAIVNDILLPLT